jgi:hypothetical protein
MPTVTTKWSARSSVVHAILGASVAPTMKALAITGQKCGSEYDNAAGANRWADFEIGLRCVDVAHAGDTISLYLVPAADGTNYGTGADDTNLPPATCLIATIQLLLLSTQQRLPLFQVPIPPAKFKLVVRNNLNHALTNTDGENWVDMYVYNEIHS